MATRNDQLPCRGFTMMRSVGLFRGLLSTLTLLAFSAGPLFSDGEEKLFVAKAFTPEKGFTPGIEGPGCDKDGNVFVVNFARQQTIGKVTPDGKAEVYLTLPGKSTGNGI